MDFLERPVRPVVRTSGFQPGNRSSILLRGISIGPSSNGRTAGFGPACERSNRSGPAR